MVQLTITEQIYLIAIWHMKENAYGVRIREKIKELTGKSMAFGTLYNNLDQLVRKGYVYTQKGVQELNRGGNTRVFYTITESGLKALKESRILQESLWDTIPRNAIV